ncbi:hypothetical protein Golax_015959 [Gossypium laxum]|uniref:Centromere protein S n=1 Tax=Gossypium laxum TaxID=34288 RepID=A0A7J8YWC7_9ROSI|nr:hypothetical protein [Gossypium laxum]
MEVDEDNRSDFEKEEEEEDDSVSDLLRDRFRLSAISIAESEAKRSGMEISPPIVACIADLAFKYIGQLAKDLELFAHHAGRKSVTMTDVIVSGECIMSNNAFGTHRNEHLAASLRSISYQ